MSEKSQEDGAVKSSMELEREIGEYIRQTPSGKGSIKAKEIAGAVGGTSQHVGAILSRILDKDNDLIVGKYSQSERHTTWQLGRREGR